MLEANSPFVVDSMRVYDIPQVMAIERESFPLPWPERAYHYELSKNHNSHYVVLRRAQRPSATRAWQPLKRLWQPRPRLPVLGYGGFWMIAGEAHVSTLAVATAWRKRGLGELLLWSMLGRAAAMGAFEATLEVRVTNEGAQKLYQKYGFETVGRRRRYYQDNGEDAWIMTVNDFAGAAYQAHLKTMGKALHQRLQHSTQE
jgi:ribosomal-protein-alanine N-acetyltransferase